MISIDQLYDTLASQFLVSLRTVFPRVWNVKMNLVDCRTQQ